MLIIQILLGLLVIAGIYLIWKVRRAFRNLSEGRLQVYLDYAGALTDNLDRIRKGNSPVFDADLHGRFGLITSSQTGLKSDAAIDALKALRVAISDGAPDAEIETSEKTAVEKIVTLNDSMRSDLALTYAGGQVPSAEVFSRKREKQ